MEDYPLFRRVLRIGTSNIIGQLASFLGVIAYANVTTPAVLGRYFLLISLVNILGSLATAGVSSNIPRELPRALNPGIPFGSALAITSVQTTAIIIVLPAFSSTIRHLIGIGILPIQLILLPTIFALVGGDLLRGEKRAPLSEKIEAMTKLAIYTCGIVLYFTGHGPFFSFMAGYGASRVLQIVAIAVAAETQPVIPSVGDIWSFFTRSKYLYLSRISNLGFEWIDTLFIGFFLGSAAVAAYEIVWRITSVSNILTNATVADIYPRLSTGVEKITRQQYDILDEGAYFYSITPIIPAMPGAFLLGADMLGIIYGGSYRYAWIALTILFLGRFAFSISSISNTILFSLDLDHFASQIDVITLLINLVLDLTLIPILGISGAALGIAITYFLSCIAKTYLVYDSHVTKPPTKRMLFSSMSAIIMGAAVETIRIFLPIRNIFNLIAIISFGILLYSTILVRLDRQLWQDIMQS